MCVVASGAFLGITNTLMTQVVMESASVPRPIASSAYNMVRFCGGAIAPFVAGKLAEHVSVQAPFYLGAGMTAIGVGALWLHRDALVPAAATVIALPPSTAPAIAPGGAAPLVLAVAQPPAREVSALVVPLARRRGGAVHVLRVDQDGRARR
jgi:MFS family permease